MASVTGTRRDDFAFLGGLAAALTFLVAFGPLQRRLELIGEDDFSRIWAGPRALLVGADPYDTTSWIDTATRLHTQTPDTPVWIYPPWVALPLLPFGALPLDVASVLWTILGVVAGVVGLRALLRAYLPGRPWMHALAPVVLLLSGTSVVALVIGQWGFLLVGAMSAIVLSLRAHRPVGAGIAALALLAKPQLFVFAAVALGVRALWPTRDGRDAAEGRRFVAVATVAGAALVAIAWLVIPSWWPAWLQNVGPRQLKPDSDTIPALLVTLFGDPAIVLAPLVLLVAVALALLFRPRGAAWLPVWLALSSAGAPYTNSYDQVALVVPLVLGASAASTISRRRGTVVFASGAAILLVGTSLLYEAAVRRHSETLGVLAPLAVFLLLFVALWPVRRAHAGPRTAT